MPGHRHPHDTRENGYPMTTLPLDLPAPVAVPLPAPAGDPEEAIGVECGNDSACEGFTLCAECLETFCPTAEADAPYFGHPQLDLDLDLPAAA